MAARDGAPAVEGAIRIAADWGMDLSRHRARRLDQAQVAAADLVVTMETRHLHEVLRLVPSALPRSFAWLELARLARAARVDGAAVGPTARLRAAVRALHEARPFTPGAMGPEDVADPIGGTLTQFDAMADTVAASAGRFVPLLGGEARRALTESRPRP